MTPVPEELRVHVTYRFGDFYRASMRIFLRKPICWIVPSVMLLIGIDAYVNQPETDATPAAFKAAVGVFLTALWLLGLPLIETRRILHAPYMKNGVTYVFTDEGVAAEYTGARNFADWSFVKGGFETKRDIFVKMRVGAHVIPKAQISAAQSELLRQIVRAHVPKAFA